MSMDLAKKTYSTTPDYFIAGTAVGIVTAAKEASAAIAAHNLVLLDGGKVKPLAAVDSSNALNVTGLYGIAAEDAASGEDAVIYMTGEFFADGLALPDGIGLEASGRRDGSGNFPGPSAHEGDRSARHHGGAHFAPPSSDAPSTS